ncbi:putative NADPH-dependent methylglyoxal reductase GRP2 [Staphylotrichum tortipilum]|uniref:NADPH-dependent methylglyoxal reductase GRP2 n=1 Tax=Staphylotrichum tortipilum TaxID=2831512 RepID=A0AAN6MQ72_9PEZI|nr:putative NADPH-dependent methylglyoxal reductase GRP2 [Staphylotrichum longicolle]
MRSPSPNDLVFLTGGTGFIGMSTLLELLSAGHRVRAAVRSESKATELLTHPKITPLNRHGNLIVTIVPDITIQGAYDSAVDQATHVIHVASPLAAGADTVPADQHHAHFIKPAVDGTINLLEAAERSGSVRRVVVTSSFVALATLAALEGRAPTDATHPITPSSRPPLAEGPYESEFAAYAASKVAALRATEAWAARVRPGFDIVHLHPGFVLGRNPAATTPAQCLRGTNSAVLALVLGNKRGAPLAGATVHIEDVARAHVAALDPAVYGGESYILSGEVRWEDAVGAAKREFGKAFEERVLMEGGKQETLDMPMDTSATEMVFGWEFKGYEEQVRSVVGQFLALRAQARRNRNKTVSRAGAEAAVAR